MSVLNLLRDKETDKDKKKKKDLLFSDDPGGVPSFCGRWYGRHLEGGGKKG